MKQKLYLTSTIALLIGVFGFFSFKNYAKSVKDKHCFTTQISSMIFDFNTFDLKVSATLDILDFKIVNKNSGKTIFENGGSLKGIGNDYGHCTFELFYKNKQIYEFGHFKFNDWHTNHYELSILVTNNEFKPRLEITGPDKNKTDLYFRKIDE